MFYSCCIYLPDLSCSAGALEYSGGGTLTIDLIELWISIIDILQLDESFRSKSSVSLEKKISLSSNMNIFRS